MSMRVGQDHLRQRPRLRASRAWTSRTRETRLVLRGLWQPLEERDMMLRNRHRDMRQLVKIRLPGRMQNLLLLHLRILRRGENGNLRDQGLPPIYLQRE